MKKLIPENDVTESAARILSNACHGRGWNNGWWHDINTGEKLERNVAELLCLVHSEISVG